MTAPPRPSRADRRADRRAGKRAARAARAAMTPAQRMRRELMTPEGVPIGVQLAGAGERIGGFVIDLLIIAAVIVALALLAGLGGVDGGMGAFVVLAIFLIRNFYFAFFELRWQGQTPGKRAMKTRVVDARGGPLTAEAIIARNLVRDVEVFIPVMLLLAPAQVWPGAPGWASTVSVLWVFAVMLLPLFNRDRARVGDLVAGTRVVMTPTAVLLPDLAAARSTMPRAVAARPVFTAEQLSIYGAYEVQVLADVLRQSHLPGHAEAALTVYESIKKKVHWQGPTPSDPTAWLEEFYVALRAHLERQMLFGKKKADKHAKDG